MTAITTASTTTIMVYRGCCHKPWRSSNRLYTPLLPTRIPPTPPLLTTKVTAEINASFPDLPPKSVYEVATGFLTIAVDHMAIAIKEITTRRGIDVAKKYALCSFGGAGGQHACLVADALGMETVFMHPYAGVLSAFGMGLADVRTIEEAVVELELTSEVCRLVGSKHTPTARSTRSTSTIFKHTYKTLKENNNSTLSPHTHDSPSPPSPPARTWPDSRPNSGVSRAAFGSSKTMSRGGGSSPARSLDHASSRRSNAS